MPLPDARQLLKPVPTIADALQLSAFVGARLVAGAEGRRRPIRQVHPVSEPAARLDLLLAPRQLRLFG